MTRRRRRRLSFTFEGEGRRRGDDAIAPRGARLRCGSGEEGDTTPERRRGERTRVNLGGSPSRRPKKKPSCATFGAFFDGFKTIFDGSRFAWARFQSADFPSPKSRTASALRSTGVLQSRTHESAVDRARRQKKAQVPVASGASGSIARTRARTPRHRPGNARRTRRTIRTSRTRVSRRTNAHRATRTSAGDTLARPLDLS
jgi:hypothetical protein